ncbi:MAG: hypothetical protein LBU65_13685, partial [Planctomycetaceae bacterium]|nr:hypothetical protein [Planctomycetaceae bacterium]
PQGDVDFLSGDWRKLYTFMLNEAARLGIEVNMNNDAGWNGSGGKWIKPEHGMQMLTWSETAVDKSTSNEITLPEPQKRNGYYRDIAVFAFPTPTDAAQKKSTDVNSNRRATPNGKSIVNLDDIIDLTGKLKENNTIAWQVPNEKSWTIVRIGHTCKGKLVGPAPTSGAGLECDKLSVAAAEDAFNGQIGRLVAENKSLTGTNKTFVSTHIDSWENGSQNWTPKMREEFKTRRGYDLWKFLPVFVGYTINTTDYTDRFLWDFRRTVSEMVLDNYVGTFKRLANERGMRLSIEAYDQAPCDHLQFGGMADEPTGEFWCGGDWNQGGSASGDGVRLNDCKGMASAGHIYGKNIIGAETFTAGNQERWLRHPANIKALGDSAFCEGINRFVFHRYSFQPWKDIKPGLMMGPWGIHYERTNTWWELTPAWHKYLARCQFMLRQGGYVADIAYVQAEDSPQHYASHPRNGYQWDHCNVDTVMQMTVKDGRFTLPSGASYKVLVLPNSDRMTPQLLKKITELADAAKSRPESDKSVSPEILLQKEPSIIGNKPIGTFGLSNYPESDNEVRELANKLWDSGKIISGKTPEQVLQEKLIYPDFIVENRVNIFHRRSDDYDIYFVANPSVNKTSFRISFRAEGQPELWYPETGKITLLPTYQPSDNRRTDVLLPLESTESVFVLFKRQKTADVEITDAITKITRNGETIFDIGVPSKAKPVIEIVNAKYGTFSDAKKTLAATETVKKLLDNNANVRVIKVADITAALGDPDFNVVKTLQVDFKAAGKMFTASAKDFGMITFDDEFTAPMPFEYRNNEVVFTESGDYELQTLTGKVIKKTIKLPQPFELVGDWQVEFVDAKNKQEAKFDKLISWSDRPEEIIKYFSGTAKYKKSFEVPKDFKTSVANGQRVKLNLGEVREYAEVVVNGKELGVLWTLNKTVDITNAIHVDKENQLEIRVTNLWCNRLIGDEMLPPNGDRNPNGTLKDWPNWLKENKPDTSGRQTFSMWSLWGKDDPLQPSGILGPVTIYAAE